MKMTTVYGLNFPILKLPDTGRYTAGTLANAAEALEGYALCLLENGQKLPSASNPTKIRLEDETPLYP